ncbi:BTAD domain-containing putative transcriptional regulator [Amycolatopsis anabasis]|uniref:BTAD domain-containing putative transcriptional regulator n=1 Tax=Amycolatopsis anabasis TaxID=1840409 RepID=UPI00131B11B4|nr:BTAD domain-containing putative transcriptional regulator [Amycolatopsis anabasis]
MLFGILGAVEARTPGGDPIALGGPRPRSLLAMLLLDAGRMVTAERLLDGIYGDEPGSANALQSQVSRLRRSLGDANLIELRPAGYRLAADPEDVDAHRFERLAREGHRALTAGEHRRAATLLREALDLWRGPALADVLDAPFARTQAARLEELRITALEDRCEAELKLGEHGPPAAELRALVAAHPLRERPRGLLMRALHGAGRQAEALAVFEDARRTLADELGADPSPELAGIHLAVLRADPALTAPAARRGVPAQLTSFVGRDAELDRIGTLLAAGRLVTLTGPGGAGKTRLAVEAAGNVSGEVCFTELAPIAQGVPQAVLRALGLRETAPARETDRLVAALADRKLLLVLDNCEHVLDETARLAARLLAACPAVRILATSREGLGITGEALCPLPPLPESPAVRLFADRAAAVSPGFTADGARLATVTRICAALDGLPLAIELAAARLRSLPLEDIAARLDDRFRLLSRGDRAAAPRHQTLYAVVEWSWDLLTPDEQQLARRLTVFTAGTTLDAAEHVCGNADPLPALAEKSLVELTGGRYRMLETIRAFAARKLTEAGEADTFRRAHAEHFLELAETADPHLRGPDQLDWLARLTAEHGNLTAALRWAVTADARIALRLIAALSWFWWLRGLRGEAAPLAAELLRTIGTTPPDGLAEEYVLCVVTAAGAGTERAEFAAHLEQTKSIILARDRTMRRPYAVFLWSMTAGPLGADVGLGETLFGPDGWAQAFKRLGQGLTHLFGGEIAEAETEFRAGADGFRAAGDRWGVANALDHLAGLADWRGDRSGFRALMDEALTLVERLGGAEDTAELLCRRASGLARGGDFPAARADFERAAAFARRVGTPDTLAEAERGLGEVARLEGDLPGAARRFEGVLRGEPSPSVNAEATRARAFLGLGRVAEARGDSASARTRYLRARALAVANRNFPVVAEAVECLAGLAADGEEAALLFGAAAALRGTAVAGDPDLERSTGRIRARIGEPAYAAAFARGAALSREDALALTDVPEPGR